MAQFYLDTVKLLQSWLVICMMYHHSDVQEANYCIKSSPTLAVREVHKVTISKSIRVSTKEAGQVEGQ